MKLTLDNFNYHLPSNLIAHQPTRPADHCNLMLIDRQSRKTATYRFYQLLDLLPDRCVMVFNTTKVRPVRLKGRKPTGGVVEVFILHFKPHNQVITAWLKPGLKQGTLIHLPGQVVLKLIKSKGKDHYLKIIRGRITYNYLEAYGHTPLPPYIKPTKPESILRDWYQPILAKTGFSIASPTASLHFTPTLLDKLKSKHQIGYLRLDVGVGTFAPITAADLRQHQMHSETYSIPTATAKLLNQAKLTGVPIVAVGTTVARTLESAYRPDTGFQPVRSAVTSLYIYPPYKFKAVDILITNFHLPKSTLLMLVSAFTSQPNKTCPPFVDFNHSLIGRAYQKAVAEGYRFYSFGDAMIIR